MTGFIHVLIVVPVPRELVVLALSPLPGPSARLRLIPEGTESEWEPRMRILCRMLLPVLLSAVFRRCNEATLWDSLGQRSLVPREERGSTSLTCKY